MLQMMDERNGAFGGMIRDWWGGMKYSEIICLVTLYITNPT
jgi:hypothetical protein